MSNRADGMLFAAFAMDHDIHKHCAACGGCILDRRDVVMNNSPIWCKGCADKLEATVPPERLPWRNGSFPGIRIEPEPLSESLSE